LVARVLWRDAQGKEGSVELSNQEILIGRAMDCAIRTDDAMVSRHHARMYWGGGQYYVEDLGSANGVFYQEQRVARHGFKHGDAVRCGSLWLRFVDTQPGHGYSQPVPQQKPEPMASVTPPPMYAAPDPLSGPYPAYRPSSSNAPPVQGATPSSAVPMLDSSRQAEANSEEIRRLNRRIEQLQTELRIYRGGKGAEVAVRIEELENENSSLEQEVSQLKSRVRALEQTAEVEGKDAQMIRADRVIQKTGETVQQLNDILSNLRINVMAAEGEFEQFANQIPRASFELIREALRSSSGDVDTAREILRRLRDLAD
jgi:hypothetical protein